VAQPPHLGDKKYVLPSLLPEFAGKVDLIYIDPPFDTGADFSFTATVPDHPTRRTRTLSPLKRNQAFSSTKPTATRGDEDWISYVRWFCETSLREMLGEDGSLYVHLDYHVSHYAKAVLDEIIGSDNFKSEIIWKRQAAHSDPKRYGPIHDTLFYYGKSSETKFNIRHVAYDQSYIESHYSLRDPDGRQYQLDNPTARGPRPGLQYTFHGVNPPAGRVWAMLPEQLYKEGRIVFTTKSLSRRRRKN